jgi:hypothetical protein
MSVEHFKRSSPAGPMPAPLNALTASFSFQSFATFLQFRIPTRVATPIVRQTVGGGKLEFRSEAICVDLELSTRQKPASFIERTSVAMMSFDAKD